MALDAPTHKLRTNYNVEVEIGGFGPGMPDAVVSYFAGNVQRPLAFLRQRLSSPSRADTGQEPPKQRLDPTLSKTSRGFSPKTE